MSGFSFTTTPFGENGWLATLSGSDIVTRALAANAAADRLRLLPGITDAVAGVESLVLRYDPSDLTSKNALHSLELTLSNIDNKPLTAPLTIDVPVCYGGAHGPDFNALCEKLSLSGDALIKLHTSQRYRVLTIGFAPGFAYLGPLPQALQTARLATPRTHVPAGSVGIAGAMTGVYALSSPGGWPLIGRTPKRLFDARAENPFVFSSGTEVRFTSIDAAAFNAFDTSA